jgi:hypothetical protein
LLAFDMKTWDINIGEREREDGVNTLEGHKSRRCCVLGCNCQHGFEIIGP